MKGVGKFGEVMAGEKARADYATATEKLLRIIRSRSQQKAVLDFVVRELRRFPHYNWVGVYVVEGEELALRAWNGPAATPHMRIPIGQGICGLAARTRETVVVGDVSKDPRYLERFPSTRSEIVVPIVRDGTAIGEIDIDSDRVDAFDDEDQSFLERIAEELVEIL